MSTSIHPSPHLPPVVLAFDVGGTSVKAAAVEQDLTVLVSRSAPSRRGPAILDVVRGLADSLLEGLDEVDPGARARVVGAGIVMLGLVDVDRGLCVRSVNLDLHDLDVVTPLSSHLAMPVVLGHDVGAAGEAIRRATPGGGESPFVVVLGTGVAAVTYVGGRPLRGAGGRQAGELGHVVVRPGGARCGCGARGCLEAIVGGGAIVRAYRERAGVHVAGADEVVARAATDPHAAAVWSEAVGALADALLDVCALLAPGAVVLGGGLAEAGFALTEPLLRAMRSRPSLGPLPPVIISGLGAGAGVVGAAIMALDGQRDLCAPGRQ